MQNLPKGARIGIGHWPTWNEEEPGDADHRQTPRTPGNAGPVPNCLQAQGCPWRSYGRSHRRCLSQPPPTGGRI